MSTRAYAVAHVSVVHTCGCMCMYPVYASVCMHALTHTATTATLTAASYRRYAHTKCVGVCARSRHSQIGVCIYRIAVSVKTFLTWWIHTISISVSCSPENLRFLLRQHHPRMPVTVASSSRDTETTTTITVIIAFKSTGHKCRLQWCVPRH